MYLKKTGLPQEGELVLCTVTKIHFNSVFANLDEYNRQGMIHISEVSPGRIRNIRDFIREDKVIVCKVLRVDTNKGHIDLSLRRVSDAQRRKKVNDIKQEQLAEKIIEFASKELKIDPKKLYFDIYNHIKEDYDTVYSAFNDIVEGDLTIDDLGIDQTVSKKLLEVITQRIKPQEVEIKGELRLETYDPNGVEIVKQALMEANDVSEYVTVSYSGGGIYKITVNTKEYKEAEEILKKSYETAIKIVEESKGTGSFIRLDKQ